MRICAENPSRRQESSAVVKKATLLFGYVIPNSHLLPIRILLLLIVVSTNLFTSTRFRRQLSKLIARLQCLDSLDWSRRVELSKYATEGLFTSLF